MEPPGNELMTGHLDNVTGGIHLQDHVNNEKQRDVFFQFLDYLKFKFMPLIL